MPKEADEAVALAAKIKAEAANEEENQEESQEIKLSETEQRARNMGHVSIEEWEEQGKEPEEWIEAKEYIGRQPLYEGLHKVNRKNKALEKKMDALVLYNEKVKENSYKRALEQLRLEKDKAIEDDELGQALKIGDRIDKLKENPPEPVIEEEKDSSINNDLLEDFIARNSWYERDWDKTDRANGMANRLVTEYNKKGEVPNWKTIISKVEEEINTTSTRKVNIVEKARSRQAGVRDRDSKKMTREDLDEDGRNVFDELVIDAKRNPHGIITAKQFFEDYGE